MTGGELLLKVAVHSRVLVERNWNFMSGMENYDSETRYEIAIRTFDRFAKLCATHRWLKHVEIGQTTF